MAREPQPVVYVVETAPLLPRVHPPGTSDSLPPAVKYRGNPCDASRWALVLPNSNRAPAALSEPAIVLSVPLTITCKLGLPVASVRDRLRAVQKTPVPEAAVNENCHASAGKSDVGARSRSSWTELVVHAKPEPESMECRPQGKLWLRVPVTVCLHGGARGWVGRRWGRRDASCVRHEYVALLGTSGCPSSPGTPELLLGRPQTRRRC